MKIFSNLTPLSVASFLPPAIFLGHLSPSQVVFSLLLKSDFVLFLIALLNLPASVQYPIVTGGVIVFSTIIDIVKKTKLKKREIIASLIAFAASAVMAL